MKGSAVTSFLSIIAATSIAAVASTFSPANAYTVTTTNNMAGNPASYLVEVGLISSDQGRQIDPTWWLVPAGTVSDPKNPSIATPIDLSALLKIKVLEFNNRQLSLDLELTNTTDINNIFYNTKPFKANIVSFGFGISPNATKVVLREAGSIFTAAEIQGINKNQGTEPKKSRDQQVINEEQQNFPGGFKQIDICIYAANGCSGGNVNQGLAAGALDKFTLDIFGEFSDPAFGASVTLSAFPLKFQTSVGSYEPAGVPEPLTVVGSGLALGFGALFKKEAAKKRKKAEVKG